MQNSSPLILVDGSSYLYRAFHAMPHFKTSQGKHTGAIYGVVNMIRKLQKDFNTPHMAVVFDAKGKTFRDDLYAEYKATRPPMPPELREQIEPLHEIIKAMGIPLLVVSGVEADDVIGTLAMQASAQKIPTVISTGDKDMAQLVNDYVVLMDTMKDVTMDKEGVEKKFGVPPEKIIDYLALMGDTSDNIPGVKGVGPKTAVNLLNQYASLQDIIEHATEIKGAVGKNIVAAIDSLPLSRQLTTIKCDVKLEFSPEQLTVASADNNKLITLFGNFEFKTWLGELLGGSDAQTQNQKKQNYQTILDQKQFDLWLKRLQKSKIFAFDTETTSLDYMQAEIVGVSFAIEPDEAAYIPLSHDYENAPAQLQRSDVLDLLKPILENTAIKKIGQNLKYDMSVLARYSINMRGVEHDTMLESYVVDSTATRHDMDSLALKYLSYKTVHFEDIAGSGKNQVTFNKIDVDQAAHYAAEDADITLKLHHVLWPKLQAEVELKQLYQEIEIPLVSVLSNIERNGVLVDVKMLDKQSKAIAKQLDKLQHEAYELAGEEFNLGSPKQLQAILFEKLGIPVTKKTPKGQPSTSEDVLQELALNYPLPKLILEHRSLSKLKSTYTDKLPERVDTVTGRVHTSYHQAVASTGRLSSTDPNLQNIPIRTPEGRKIRQAFIAPPGYALIAADYSQIELRIMAHLSEDNGLLRAFSDGVDIHRATAAEVFGSTPEAVSNEARRRAKAINFGLIYGMSAFGLARQLGIGRNEAQEYVDLYFERYPGVKAFMDFTRDNAKKVGYVKTVFGRRLYLPDINHSNFQRRQYAERTAINAPMQGTAADIIKLAMIKTQQWIDSSKIDIKMIMQVHDELVFEVNQSVIDDVKSKIENCMTSVAKLKVPLQVDIGQGANWDEAH